MSTEIVKRDSVEESVSIGKLGEIFVKSGFFRDTRDQYQAVVKILYGRELGFAPVVSMMGVHIIDGKPSLSANLLGTLVKRSGKYNYKVKESTATRCEIEFFEDKESVGNSVFTIEDAKLAGVASKQNWQKYPKAMLFSRALSAGVKLHCPDVSACPIYVPEELGAEVNEEGEVRELPKSAKPVAVTTEDIVLESREIGGRDKGATTVNEKAYGQAPETDGRTVPVSPTVNEGGAGLPPPSPAPVEDGDFCGAGEQVNFFLTFHEALRTEIPRSLSDVEARKWLAQQGYKDNDGVGHVAGIVPRKSFSKLKIMARKYAATI